jgi:hypothetical protein
MNRPKAAKTIVRHYPGTILDDGSVVLASEWTSLGEHLIVARRIGFDRAKYAVLLNGDTDTYATLEEAARAACM